MKDKHRSADQVVIVHVTTLPSPADLPRKTPLVFVHGGSHTGACYIETPDGRDGWARYTAARGRTSYVIDWPGHGGSPSPVPLHELSMQHVADAIVELLADVGPAVLVTHSMGGVVGWRAAELARDNVKAVVAIAPGPPANLQPGLESAEIVRIRDTDPQRYAELGRPAVLPMHAPVVPARETALAMWANSARFPYDAVDGYIAALVNESPRAMNERSNLDGMGLRVAGPAALAGIPIVVITGDSDPRHPRVTDERIATYFGADFIWLADRGMPGHGHMMMIEHGNDAIADLFLNWLDARGV
jgi:pimeloyl-ACP methyl ester carboxylesterase